MYEPFIFVKAALPFENLFHSMKFNFSKLET